MNHSNSYISNSERVDAAMLLRKLAIFGLPFLIAASIIVVVDPFDFLRIGSWIPGERKASVSKQLDPCFWNLNRFEAAPTENILLGDSRMEAMSADTIRQVSGEEYTNLAYGGGTLREAFDTFWIAAKRTKLRRVYIGISVSTYNDYEISNRVQFYSSARENPGLYFVNRGVWESSFYIVRSFLTGDEVRLGVPPMAKNEFWLVELETLKKYYDKYVEPRKYRKELQEISEYCRANGIDLNFIIMPMHKDAQLQLDDPKVREAGLSMRSDLSRFGRMWDFETDSELNRDASHFNDPVHTDPVIREMLINEVWGGQHNNSFNIVDNN